MIEFINENKVLLIIVGSVVLAILISFILSIIIRKKQIKKDSTLKLQKTSDFKKYHVKVVKVEDINIENVKKEQKNETSEDNTNYKF